MSNDAYRLLQEGVRLLDQGSWHAAIVPLAKARDQEPEKASIREALARAYFRSRQYAESRIEFENLIEINPANDYAYFGLGKCLDKLGELDLAQGQFRLALAMSPENPDYKSALNELADQRQDETSERSDS